MMWQLLIENLPRKRWNTKQHVPPCIPKVTTEEQREALRQRLREANARRSAKAYVKNLDALKRITYGKESWATNEVSLGSKDITLKFHRTLESNGLLIGEKIMSPRPTLIWRWK
jgi:hypothetical protein